MLRRFSDGSEESRFFEDRDARRLITLLRKGVLGVSNSAPEHPSEALSQAEEELLASLAKLGSASPGQLAADTGKSLATVQRWLRRLLVQGRVRKTGSTKAVRYSRSSNPKGYV